MSDLEARIAEVLAGHQLVGISLHEDARCTGSGCGWTPTSSFLFPTADHRAHVAQMLAPVIREAQAEALETFGHMYLNPEQDENYNKTARAGRGYYRALIETRAKRIRSNDE